MQNCRHVFKMIRKRVAVRSYQFAFNTWLFYRVISAAYFHKKEWKLHSGYTKKKGVKKIALGKILEICAGTSTTICVIYYWLDCVAVECQQSILRRRDF